MKKGILKIKCNTDLLSHKKGEIVQVPSVNGVPKDKFWRKRLADAEFDSCCEIVKGDEKKTEKPIKKKESNESEKK